ncbi:hypothetical protein RXV94_09045 [Yeosuana sp. MJ-SS3]|uniref:DUF4395 domain-containing protein n=1 Tax=Gilvirhabdus luticola TaxID=3079858 RepID=A0ABU3U7L5_9FLAO|nr:hypothetical protein [Yeosuana sp. MJ-SS3]MDU8886304.1 hypothetical protein [Yeosuana sp. MJ-SS3]
MILFKDELKEIFQGKPPSIEKPDKHINPRFIRVQKVNPISFTKGALIYLVLSCIGVLVSSTIATYVFFGSITLAGLIAIAESNRYVRYAIVKSNRLIDLSIFGLSIFATLFLGVTLTASLTFAGLGYTLIYAPYLRSK